MDKLISLCKSRNGIIGIITIIGISFTTIVSSLSYLGLTMPRPAWAHELEEAKENLEENIKQLDIRVLEREIEDIEMDLHRCLNLQNDYKNKGIEVPSYLLDQELKLKRKLDRQLKKLEEK